VYAGYKEPPRALFISRICVVDSAG
jgi:hypothetical protein